MYAKMKKLSMITPLQIKKHKLKRYLSWLFLSSEVLSDKMKNAVKMIEFNISIIVSLPTLDYDLSGS